MARGHGCRTGLNCLLILLISAFSFFLSVSANVDSVPVDEENLAPVIGIDFGDSYTRVAAYINGTSRILTNADGDRSLPTYVALTEEGPLVGKAAKNYLKEHPNEVISDFRKLLGRTFEDVIDELENIPYEVFDNDGLPNVRVRGEVKYSIKEVVSMFLVGVKAFAEEALGQEVKSAVVAVPVYFDDTNKSVTKQRDALKEAGELAELNILRIVKEPVAAAMAYGFGMPDDSERDGQYVLVHDIGGQNHDVTVLHEDEGVFEVVGNAHTRGSAGALFTTAVMGLLLEQNDEEEFFRLYENPEDFIQFEDDLERAKHDLCFQVSDEVDVRIPGLEGKIASHDFEEHIISSFNPTHVIKEALKKADLTKDDIHDIVLVGGSSTIPFIRDGSARYFSKAPVFSYTVDPTEAVAIGAGIQGYWISGADAEPISGVEIMTSGIGVKTTEKEDALLVKRFTAIPISKSQMFTTVHDDQREVVIKLYEHRFVAEIPEGEDFYEKGVIGLLRLSDLPAAPRGTAYIKVNIDIDPNFNLRAEATHVETGRSASLTLENGPPYRYVDQSDIPKGGEVTLLEVSSGHDEL